MKVLITGSKGFIGQNLVAELMTHEEIEVMEYHRDTNDDLLSDYCRQADFVFHLAGVNRPEEESEFINGNVNLTNKLLKTLNEHDNTCPIMMSSSTQAELDNLYGQSKYSGEQLVYNYSKKTGAKALIYRFPNVFGKWSKPNYNSVIATFCYNIAHDMPIQINNPAAELNLVYIDDLISELIDALNGQENKVNAYCEVDTVHKKTLQEIADLIYSFRESRQDKSIPNMDDSFTKKLYSTYLSFLPEDEFNYPLKMNVDERGSFTEILKTKDRGQVSVNISKPGITKGNHWHHTKNEKFLVVSGQGVIRFRKVNTDEVIEYYVSDKKLEVIDIPVGYTHNIANLGETDMVTIMWVNEIFNPDEPDTYFLEV